MSAKTKPARRKTSAPRPSHKPVRRRMPYLEAIETRGAVSVWRVDGAFVRRNIDEEFSNFGHHYSYAAIPLNEVWLDVEGVPDEERFFLHHAWVERALMARGRDCDAARLVANREERQMRVRAGDVRKLHQGKTTTPTRRNAGSSWSMSCTNAISWRGGRTTMSRTTPQAGSSVTTVAISPSCTRRSHEKGGSDELPLRFSPP